MANAPVRRQLTNRDSEILLAIDRCPLTAAQLRKLSVTFAEPFLSARSVHERLQKLRAAGWVRRWPYATATSGGSPHYYRLTPLGYQLLHGASAEAPSKRHFSELGISRHRHAFCLAEFVVHTAVAAHRRRLHMARFYRENTLQLSVDGQTLFPDCAFELHAPGGLQLNYVVEIDNSTERIESPKDADSWQRKLIAYDRLQHRCHPHRFRVLIVTTRSAERLRNLLACAGHSVSNPDRQLFLGTHLDDYLAEHDATCAPCFRDHAARPASLVPPHVHSAVPRHL